MADFYGTPLRGEQRLTTTFTDTSAGTNTEWYWTFGDGSHSFERNPVHYYEFPGSFTVSLTVRGDLGESTVTKADYVIVGSDITKDIAPKPERDMYLRGVGFVFKRAVGIEIRRVSGIY